jgi:hypothetical protein
MTTTLLEISVPPGDNVHWLLDKDQAALDAAHKAFGLRPAEPPISSSNRFQKRYHLFEVSQADLTAFARRMQVAAGPAFEVGIEAPSRKVSSFCQAVVKIKPSRLYFN